MLRQKCLSLLSESLASCNNFGGCHGHHNFLGQAWRAAGSDEESFHGRLLLVPSPKQGRWKWEFHICIFDSLCSVLSCDSHWKWIKQRPGQANLSFDFKQSPQTFAHSASTAAWLSVTHLLNSAACLATFLAARLRMQDVPLRTIALQGLSLTRLKTISRPILKAYTLRVLWMPALINIFELWVASLWYNANELVPSMHFWFWFQLSPLRSKYATPYCWCSNVRHTSAQH